ncbi:MBL fold metallo-hydrolase [Pseudoflavonifractor sp. HCP28S3_F10]|uniref:MBL fold metallo-hydrolase n=1 Tax=Pseudoflavonifractor sp. HCP28S3_F10 TaxID=3438947 RepID=UPI003F8C0F93
MTGGIRQKRDLPLEREDVPRPVPRTWWEGPDPIRLTLTANAGILLSWRDHKLLVDGLHSSRDHDYSPVPRSVLDAIQEGKGMWGGVEWVFYTHLHLDHFSGRETLRLMEKQPVRRLFLPAGEEGPGISPDIGELRAWLMASAAPVQELSLPEYRPACWPLAPDARVTAIRCAHIGEGYEDVEYYCFLFQLGARTVLFLGDAACDADYFRTVLRGCPVDTAVVNPLFLTRPDGRETIREAICPRRLVVDHIPFACDDRMRMRRLVSRTLIREEERLPPAAVLWDEGDGVIL